MHKHFAFLCLLIIFSQLLATQTPVPFRKELLPCVQGWDLWFKQTHIVNIDSRDDSLLIHLSLMEDCTLGSECDSFTVDLKDDTLFLDVKYITTHVSEPCPASCLCCFQMMYHLPLRADEISYIYYRGENITNQREKYKHYGEPTFEIYQGDTINYTDKHGITRGLWLVFNEDSTLMAEFLHHQNTPCGIAYKFDSLGNKKVGSLYISNNSTTLISGKLYFEYGEIVDRKFEYRHGAKTHQIIRNAQGLLEKIIVIKEDGTEIIIR